MANKVKDINHPSINDRERRVLEELGICNGAHFNNLLSVHDKFHRTLILSGFCLLKIAKISLNSSFFPKPI
ncbi:hypothetical protein ACXYS3_24780, partial [Escherichia coli]